MAQDVTDSNFDKEVLESKETVLIDFWAPWCGPCRQLTPIVEEVAKEMEGKVKVVKCNIDDNPETPSKYAIRGVPTLMIFKGGEIVDTKVGSIPKSSLVEWINGNI